jgi:sensor domain CHASE-containing protein
MLFVWFCRLLLLLAFLLATRKGDEPERLVAITIVAMLGFDIANHQIFGDPTWFEVNPGHFVIDLWALLSLTWVALKANRGWPLWISATQLLVVMAHFAKLLEIDEALRGYWIMTKMPAVAQILLVMFGTFAHMIRQRRIGPYPAWRPT